MAWLALQTTSLSAGWTLAGVRIEFQQARSDVSIERFAALYLSFTLFAKRGYAGCAGRAKDVPNFRTRLNRVQRPCFRAAAFKSEFSKPDSCCFIFFESTLFKERWEYMYTLYTGESNVTHCACKPRQRPGRERGRGRPIVLLYIFRNCDKPLSWWVTQHAL